MWDVCRPEDRETPQRGGCSTCFGGKGAPKRRQWCCWVRHWQLCSHRLSEQTTVVSGTVWPQFAMQVFYRAMHFSAKRGIAIACRLYVRLSVCLSVTLVNCDHIGWNASKKISPLVSLGRSLFATPTWRVCSKRNTPKFGPKVTHPLLIWASETFDCKLRPNGYI